jgi:catechol 2,3-dioxygenase-like lactoylglutathione lyase family enzyme
MTARVRGITIDVTDLERSAIFWGSLLGVEVTGRYDTYLWLDEIAPGVRLILQQVAELKEAKNRVHLDVHPDAGKDLVALVESLGGTRLSNVGDPSYSLTVMADPDGNEFCVLHQLSGALGGMREVP